MGTYFKSRIEAGQQLAPALLKYRYENSIVLALSDGSVQVAEQIASHVHCILTLLLFEDIEVPGESISLGTIDQEGGFSYSATLPELEREEYYNEYHGSIDEQKRGKFQKINHLLGEGGTLDRDVLRDHTIILVADGLADGALIDAAVDFLKPIRIERLVMVAPIVSVAAVDRMHVLADELHVLGVTDNFLSIDHYYEVNDVPTHEETIQKINQIILNWQ
jgi:putative phosphoribosyl transferase